MAIPWGVHCRGVLQRMYGVYVLCTTYIRDVRHVMIA